MRQREFGWDFVNSADRLTKPLIREGGKFREASWDEALDVVARKFREIKAKNGPDSLALSLLPNAPMRKAISCRSWRASSSAPTTWTTVHATARRPRPKVCFEP